MRLCLGRLPDGNPCPEIQDGPRCAGHRREMEQARGSAAIRGYDRPHRAERERWRPDVEAGLVGCARCGEVIEPGQVWDLGHTEDRTGWTGAEHQTCNRAAAGRSRAVKE